LYIVRGETKVGFSSGRGASSEDGFNYYLAMESILAGWAEAPEGDVAGLDQLREVGCAAWAPSSGFRIISCSGGNVRASWFG